MSSEPKHDQDPSREIIFEDLSPGKGLNSPKVFVAEAHHAGTRRGLAMAIIIILGLLYTIAAVALVCDAISIDELIKLVAAFSGVQTLAAAAAGFFFAKDQH